MVIKKMKPTATIVAQLTAGLEVDVIAHNGTLYIPMVSMPDFLAEEAPKATKKAEPVVDTDDDDEEDDDDDDTDSSNEYTEEELQIKPTKELEKICKEMGIDYASEPGKNTNKKLRDLILKAQEEGVSEADEDDDDDEEDDDDSASINEAEVKGLLQKFEDGELSRKKVSKELDALTDDEYNEDALNKVLDEIEEDDDADLDEYAEKVVAILSGNESDEEDDDDDDDDEEDDDDDEEDELVEASDLKVGDKVSVYWADENEDWFDGEVVSIKKGKVTVHYEDDDKVVIDPEVHTKIKRK